MTVITPGSRALRELLAGTLNRVTCDACGATSVLDVPLLYRDDAGRFFVYMLSQSEQGDWRDDEAAMDRLAKEVFEQGNGIDPPLCRLVTHRSALIEKIALRDRGLDDRAIEYVKYQLLRNPDESHRLDPVRHRLLFDFSADLSENLPFLVFDRESGQATAGAHIPMAVYREVTEALLGSLHMRKELESLFPGCYVSVDRLL